MISAFKEKVLEVVKNIPSGKVVSYGQVALYVGIPRAAREVGWVLNGIHNEDSKIPWWRVVNNTGRISIKGSAFSAQNQKELLKKEGVSINPDLTFDISKYRFQPGDEFIKKLKLDPNYLEMILDRMPYNRINHKK